MKTINIKLLVYMILSMGLYSCEKVIDVELNNSEPRITIEGSITPDLECRVKVSKSKNYYEENNYAFISGAIVVLTDSEGNTETLYQDTDGLYKTSVMKGVEGRSYNLSVEVEDKTYTATSTLPQLVPIIDIKMYHIPAFDRVLPCLVYLDPAGEVNYYRQKLYVNDKRMKSIYVTRDEDRDGKPIEQVMNFNTDDNNENDLEVGDKVFIELQTIDKGVYDFFETWSRITELQTNPISNIKGGALGYFSAYSFDTKEIIIEEW